MNLKEAKEYLQNNGFAVQRLNECGYGGCGDDDFISYSKPRTTNTRGGLKNISSLLGDAPQVPSPNADAMIQNLIEQIPDSKKEAVIQLLRILVLGGK